MPKKKPLDDVDALPIPPKAKRIVRTFLDTEFTPTISLNPQKARQQRQRFLQEINAVAGSFREGTITCRMLATELSDLAECLILDGRKKLGQYFEDLALSMESVSGRR